MSKSFWIGLIPLTLLLIACGQDTVPAAITPTGRTQPLVPTGFVTLAPTPTLSPPPTPALKSDLVLTNTVGQGETVPVGTTGEPAVTSTAETANQATMMPPTRPPSSPSPAAGKPQIDFFEVEPLAADAGQTIMLSWSGQGEQAVICPSTRYILFTPADCQAVPLAGSLAFTIPLEAAGNPTIDFQLTISQTGTSEPALWQVSVALNCSFSWFFSEGPLAGTCPQQAQTVFAAFQRFERGVMIWLGQQGRYLILQEAILYAGEPRKQLSFVHDPLDIIRDTSAEIQPPNGLFAPASGIGLVWRGDTSNSPGYREALGWALAPEFGYAATYQCDNTPPSGGRSWQFCYLSGPDGEIFVFHPLGGWLFFEELS